MSTFLGIVVFGGFIAFMIWASFKMRTQKSDDKNEILQMSNEELITDYNRTIFQLNQLPKYLMHGDIHKHTRLTRNLKLIEKELIKQGLKNKS